MFSVDNKGLMPIHYIIIKDKLELLKGISTERHVNILHQNFYLDN
jgi:hypothetical protein